jgi:hypothetical protein
MRHSCPDHFADDGFQSAARGGSPYVATHSWMALMMESRFHPAPLPVRALGAAPAIVAGAMWMTSR